MICRYSFDTRLTYVNETYCKAFGKNRENLIGSSFLELVPSESRLLIDAQLRDMRDDKNPITYENHFIDSEGNTHWYEWTDYVVANDAEVVEFQSVGRDITQTRLAERALESEHRRLQAVIEGSRIGTWEWNIQTGSLIVNELWAGMLGYILKELGPVDISVWKHFVHPEDFIKSNEQLEQVFSRKKQGYDIECRMKHKDGHWVWVHDVGDVIRWSADGAALLMYGTHADISHLKEAEERLSQIKQNYETFFNSIEDFLFVLDGNGNVLHTNTTVIRRLGYSISEIIGQSVLMVHPPQYRAEAARTVGMMLLGEMEFCPIPLQTKNGELIPVETRVFHGIWDNKPVVFGVTKDISRIKLSEEKFSKLFQLNPSACALIDKKDKSIIDVNKAFSGILGFSQEEVIGKNVVELNLISDRKIEMIGNEENVPGVFHSLAVELMTKSGEIKQMLVSSENIDIQDRKCQFMVGTDISELSRMEKSLMESNRQLEKAKIAADAANVAKSRFLANMSHEIRTPMNAVLGFANLLFRDQLLLPVHRDYATYIVRNGEYLLRMINQVLDQSKIESGQVVVHELEFDIHEFLHGLWVMFRLQAQDKALEFNLNYIGQIPTIVKADEGKIRQILINLLGNAFKFTISGYIQLRIAALSQGEKIRLVFEVEDTGTGIVAEELEKIFEPFYQASASSNLPGTGLGLSISRHLATLIGGTLSVHSTPGVGSCFRLEVPVEAVFSPHIAPLQNEISAELRVLAPSKEQRRVLVVSDSQDQRVLVAHSLQGTGFLVREASDLITGLKDFEAWNPHSVIIDLQDLGVDRAGFCQAVKKIGRENVFIVMISGHVSKIEEQTALEAGADCFLLKPYHPDKLSDILRRALGILPASVSQRIRKTSVPAALSTTGKTGPIYEMVRLLADSVENGDIVEILKTIELISQIDDSLALHLKELAEAYDYHGLQVWLNQEMKSNRTEKESI